MALFNNIISLFGKPIPDAEQHPPQNSKQDTEVAQEATPQKPPTFSSDRIFYQSGFRNQDSGWYFNARGETTQGPFLSRSLATAHLNAFITHCQEEQDTGGRALNHQG